MTIFKASKLYYYLNNIFKFLVHLNAHFFRVRTINRGKNRQPSIPLSKLDEIYTRQAVKQILLTKDVIKLRKTFLKLRVGWVKYPKQIMFI